jgi:hypothetical protein
MEEAVRTKERLELQSRAAKADAAEEAERHVIWSKAIQAVHDAGVLAHDLEAFGLDELITLLDDMLIFTACVERDHVGCCGAPCWVPQKMQLLDGHLCAFPLKGVANVNQIHPKGASLCAFSKNGPASIALLNARVTAGKSHVHIQYEVISQYCHHQRSSTAKINMRFESEKTAMFSHLCFRFHALKEMLLYLEDTKQVEQGQLYKLAEAITSMETVTDFKLSPTHAATEPGQRRRGCAIM